MPRPARDPNWLTTGEAARVLGVSQDTVFRMATAGELMSQKTDGGHRRIPRAAVEAVLEGRDEPASAAA